MFQNPVTYECTYYEFSFFYPGINAVLDECILNSSHNSTIVKCDLACFSPELECVLSNITTNNVDVTSLIMNTTSNITGSLTRYNYPTQLITLTNLTSGTTYNYCVVAINVTNMMEVGDPVCGSFSTNAMVTATDGMLKYTFFTMAVYSHY